MALITSRNNSKIKFIRSLSRSKPRQAADLLLVEGIRPVGEAVEAGAEIHTLVYAPDLLTSSFALDLVTNQKAAGTQVIATTPSVFDTLAQREHPQGILAVVHLAETHIQSLHPGNFSWGCALVSPQDPGNVGTILRTVDAVGASGLLLIDNSVDRLHPTLVRASMGALFWKPIIQVSFADFKHWALDHQYTILGTSAHAELDYRELSPVSKPLILLMGSEREGLTPLQAGLCSEMVKLPMRGRSTSLNLSIATGIMLYVLLDRLEA